MNNQSSISTIKNLPAEESHLNLSLNTLLAQDLMNTLMLKICLKVGTGEMLMESTIFLGLKINTFLLTAEAAGLKELPAPLLTESTLLETELGLMFLFHLKSSSTAKLEVVATEEILEESTHSPKPTESLKRAAKTTWLKILTNSHALPFKNVKTALILKVRSLETKATVGLLLVIQFGKYLNTVLFQVLTKWKLRSSHVVLFHAVLMQLWSLMLIQVVFSQKQNFCLQSITRSQSSDGAKKTELSFGLDVTVGEPIGENLAFSESRCIETTWPLRLTAHGVQLRKILTTWLLSQHQLNNSSK